MELIYYVELFFCQSSNLSENLVDPVVPILVSDSVIEPSRTIHTQLGEQIIKQFLTATLRLVTARVRTYDGRLCFHRCVSVQLSGAGGTPSKVWLGGGGTPSQVYPGYPPDQVWIGYPPQTWDGEPPTPDLGQGTPPGPGMGNHPPQTWDRVPPLDLGWGTPPPPTWDGEPPPLTWDGGTPPRPGLD